MQLGGGGGGGGGSEINGLRIFLAVQRKIQVRP